MTSSAGRRYPQQGYSDPPVVNLGYGTDSIAISHSSSGWFARFQNLATCQLSDKCPTSDVNTVS